MKKIALIFLIMNSGTDAILQSFYLESLLEYNSCIFHKDSEFLTINPAAIYNTLKDKSIHSIFIHTEQSCFDLDLIESSIVSKDCIRNFKLSDQKNSIRTFKVINRKYPEHITALTISKDFFCLRIFNGATIILIESSKSFDFLASRNEYILHTENAHSGFNIACGVSSRMPSEPLSNPTIGNHSSFAQCIIIDIALACDRSVFNKQGSVANAEAFMINVLNQVQTNYDDEFPTSIEFNVTSIFIADQSSVDPWNSVNNIDEHLEVFRIWANGGGFGGASYSVATAWTIKYSGTYGLAYLGSLCSSERYNVCSDFSFGIGTLRGLQAHELGHNFNCNHDSGGSPFIMAPGINSSVKWSTSSISSLESFLKTVSCYGICSINRAPIADFEVDKTEICPYESILFKDLSFGNPTQWDWKFPGGLPSQSNKQNPIVSYSKGGEYNVSLKVSNVFGQDEMIMNGIIKVENTPLAAFDYYIIDDKLYTSNRSQDFQVSSWNFGDGNNSIEDEPIHQYIKDGDYTIKLCVTNSCTTHCTAKIISINTKLKINYSLTQSSPCVPSKLQIQNNSNATQYYWILDGPEKLTNNTANPIFQINKSGKYRLSLKAFKSKDSLDTNWNQELIFHSAIRCPEYKK